MIFLIAGTTHTGKTLLSQKLLEKHKMPYFSIDHLKMGLIRSGNTTLTPEDDAKLTEYLWPIVREMIKTAIENKQNMIIEGCYIPFNWRKDFDLEYQKSINFLCLAMTDDYIDKNFENIKAHASDIEQRLDDSDLSTELLKSDNHKNIEGFQKAGERLILIDKNYESLLKKTLEIPENILTSFVEETYEAIGDNLLGVYLHGSAAMGCFNSKSSDLDLLVGVKEALDDSTKRRFMDKIVALHERFVQETGSFHAGLEISVLLQKDCKPFIYPTPFDLHFSSMHLKWYKDNPDDYIQRMKGTDEDLAAHITITRSRGRCLFGVPIKEFFGEVPAENYFDSIRSDIKNAESEIIGKTTYLALNLARVLAFKKEGLVLSKLEGGFWALKNIPSKYHTIIKAALTEYENAYPANYNEKDAVNFAKFMLESISSA